MPAPWEQKWNEVKQEVEEVVDNASKTLQNALPWARDWKAKATPQQAPVALPEPIKQLPNDPDGFWSSFQQKWKENAPKVQAEISAIKQKEFGAELPDAIKNLEKALSGKGLDGTVRRILRTEYRDLTGKEFNSRNKDVKPLSNVDRRVLPASKVGDVFDAASEFAQAAGEKVQDVALAAGAGVNTSAALATAGEMLADPLNLIPGGKGVAAVGAIASKDFLKVFPDFAKSIFKQGDDLIPLYHGTSKDVPFKDLKSSTRGIWLTKDPKGASQYAMENDSMGYAQDGWKLTPKNTASRVMPVYAKVENPYTISGDEAVAYSRAENYVKYQREKMAWAKANGYDAIIYPDGAIAVADAKQIKSAISPDMKVGAGETVKADFLSVIDSKIKDIELKAKEQTGHSWKTLADDKETKALLVKTRSAIVARDTAELEKIAKENEKIIRAGGSLAENLKVQQEFIQEALAQLKKPTSVKGK